jgi:outer membrane protein assembly factor BamB
MRRGASFLALAGLLLAASPAGAVITALTPLAGVLNENQLICTAVVESVDPEKPGMVLALDEALKGKPPFKKLAVNLTGDADSQKKQETLLLLKRVAPKVPLLLFINQNDKNFTAVAYSNGTWFQMAGVRDDDGDVVRLPFTHLEPYLRRTYKGTTAELKQVVVDGLAGKKEPPDPNQKEKPGIGPEVGADAPKEKDKEESSRPSIVVTRGPVFGVIPMLVVGPLALLAMLFPAVFGGLMLVMRRWTTALTVLSVNSLLLFLQDWFGAYLLTSWWGTPAALWLAMSLVTVCGALWAWRKHNFRIAPVSKPTDGGPWAGAPDSPTGVSQYPWSQPMARTVDFFPPPKPAQFEPPHKGELIALGVLSLFCVGTAAALMWPAGAAGVQAKAAVMFAAAVCAAALHACYLRWVVARSRNPRPGLPGEGVLLGVMLLGCVVFGFTTPAQGQAAPSTGGPRTADAPKGPTEPGERVVRLVDSRELFHPREPAWIVASPRVAGDRLYVGAVHGAQYQSGALYCLDRATGAVHWTFNDGGRMKNSFSSPWIEGGRIYVGEGFHQQSGCKLYCLDADKGTKVWEFPTRSHTESSPCVADGKVYFGAGDDGLYCIHASDGSPAWDDKVRPKGLHVDAGPLVVGGRVYCGSGVGDAYKETCVFCADAETGQEIWRRPTDLPVWGESVVSGGRLYVGIGNGNFMDSDEKPAGAVLCLDAATGAPIWRRDVPDGVLVRVAVDRDCVYFASRDQNCYCLDRAEGRVLWKKDLGSPVTASPVLVRCPECGCAEALYVVAGDGLAYRLDPATGAEAWKLDLGQGQKAPEFFSSPTVVESREADGDHRRLYFGAGFNFFQRGGLYCVEDVTERKPEGK